MSKQIKNKNKSHLFEGGGFSVGGDFGISGTVGFVNGMKSSFDDVKQKSENYEDQINNSQIADLSKVNDLDTLEDYANSIRPIDHITTDDLTGNLKQRFGKYLSTSGQAAQAGSNYGPWGLLIGSVVGQIGAGLSDTFSRKKARNKRRELNDRIDLINKQNQDLLANNASNIMQNQLAEQQWNYIAALGGNLHSNSTTWGNGLNYIGAGGSHESNPNDGVAISTAPDGLENKVEEGEVVWNDNYVFSKRLTIPEKDKKANKWKGKTYADVAKELMDNSEERPNDPITLRGLDDALSRLRDSQDELKAKQEERKIKKEIASMPPEMLAQLQQQAQQPTEEEMAQQAAMEQQQMPMVDPLMQQPMMEQPPMYAKGGHLLKDAGNVKAVSGKGFFTPLPQPQIEGINNLKIPTLEEMKIAKDTALTDYINKQAEYVNVKDAQRYGGFYNDVDKVNEYLSGNTPMDVNNVAQGVANQQSKEAGRVYLGRVPVKKNYGLDENSSILDRDNEASVNFFLKKNPNLNLDSDAIYFYSKDKNDEVDKNKFLKADKVNQEIYDKNSVENISRISGINFNRANTMAKGGHLHAVDPYLTVESGYYKNNTELLKDPYRGYSLAQLRDLVTNYPQVQSEIDKRLTFLNNQKTDSAPIPEADLSFIEDKYKPGYVSNKVADTDDVIDALGRKSVFKNSEDRKKYAEKNLQKNIDNITSTAKAGDQDNSSSGTDWSTYARFAPVVGSAIGAISSMFNKPDYDNPKRIERIAKQIASPISPKYIGDYLRYRPLDETYYLNQLNAQQNAANNAIVGLSNGNRSMALASMLANDYNYNNQRGAAYRQGLEYNEAQRQRAAEFNRGTNQFNAQQYMQAAAQNASNRAQAANLISAAAQMREGIDNAYGASQSANWTNLFNNIGNVGRDEMNRNMTNGLYDYGWLNRSGDWGFNGQSRKSKRGGYLTIKTNNRRKE